MVPSTPRVAVGSSWGPVFLFVRLTISQILSTLNTSLSTLNPLHYTHLTQHLRYTILYLLVFFVKKNLEHIRKSYVLFIYLFLLV